MILSFLSNPWIHGESTMEPKGRFFNRKIWTEENPLGSYSGKKNESKDKLSNSRETRELYD